MKGILNFSLFIDINHMPWIVCKWNGGIPGEGSMKRDGGIPGVRLPVFSTLRPGSRIGGGDKVPLFLKSINERGRMAIFPDLEDNEGAYGLTEDWYEVE